MGTIAFQEMTAEEIAATTPEIKTKDKTVGKVVYSTQDSDRALDEEETFAEDNAKKLSKGKFAPIKPIYGTLGYLFRNLSGGKFKNDSIIECFRTASHTNKSKFIKELIIIYENMDENSRHRVDFFDWFCRKQNVSIAKFWGAYQEGAFSYEDAIVQSAISASKQHLIEVVQKFSNKEKNFNDRKLLADINGLAKDSPLVALTDNSQTANVFVGNGNKITSFMESLRRSENKSQNINEDKLLTEGHTDFIEGELVKEDDIKEPILRESKVNEQLLVERG